MADKKKYYKLDDIGVVGTQTETSAAKKYHALKTSVFIRNLREEKLVYKKEQKKAQ